MSFVRALLRDAATPERIVWQRLRASQLGGLKFRRQAPIGPYIVDFFCPAVRLVVELDGETHVDAPGDRLRDAWLAREGYRVLCIWNNEVTGNLEGVLQLILLTARGENPSPRPSPPRGEGADTALSPWGRGLGEG